MMSFIPHPHFGGESENEGGFKRAWTAWTDEEHIVCGKRTNDTMLISQQQGDWSVCCKCLQSKKRNAVPSGQAGIRPIEQFSAVGNEDTVANGDTP